MTCRLSSLIARRATDPATDALFVAEPRRPEAVESARAGIEAVAGASPDDIHLVRPGREAWLMVKDRTQPHRYAFGALLTDLDPDLDPSKPGLVLLARTVSAALASALQADADPDGRDGAPMWRCAERIGELLPLVDARSGLEPRRIEDQIWCACATPWSDARFGVRSLPSSAWIETAFGMEDVHLWSRALPSCIEIAPPKSSLSVAGNPRASRRISISAIRNLGPHRAHDAMSRLRIERDLRHLLRPRAAEDAS